MVGPNTTEVRWGRGGGWRGGWGYRGLGYGVAAGAIASSAYYGGGYYGGYPSYSYAAVPSYGWRRIRLRRWIWLWRRLLALWRLGRRAVLRLVESVAPLVLTSSLEEEAGAAKQRPVAPR